MKKLKLRFWNETKRVVRLLKQNYDPERVIVFGSVASGEVKRDSDIDLLVIKDTKKGPWARLKDVDKFMDHRVPVDILVYTPEEIKEGVRTNDYFLGDILTYGKVAYQK